MLHTLTLPDGTVIGSGAGEPALRSVKLTTSVGERPLPGGVCAGALEVTLFADRLLLSPGDRVELRDEQGLVGVFFVHTVTEPAPGQRKVVAYDAVSRLDGSADGFLEALTFPVQLGQLARLLAAHFGLELTGTLLNADLSVPAFRFRGITGRQLMGWICEAGGRFCRAAGDRLELAWFSQSTVHLHPTGDSFYYQGALELATGPVLPPDQVVIAQSSTDVGIAYPEVGSRPWRIEGNPLLTQPGDAAQVLQQSLSGFSFTPCTVTTPVAVAAGSLFTVNGTVCAAMTVERSEGKVRITGSGSNGVSHAPVSLWRAMAGRVLEVQTQLQGILTRLAEFDGDGVRLSQIAQEVDAITARVAVLDAGTAQLGASLETMAQTAGQEFAQLALRADGLEVSVGRMGQALEDKADALALEQLSHHFRFGEDGLTISDRMSGMGIGISEEAVVFTGGDPSTRITPTGMTSTDITVENRLSLGDFVLLPKMGGNLALRWQGGMV